MAATLTKEINLCSIVHFFFKISCRNQFLIELARWTSVTHVRVVYI